ncbi:MAG: phytase, partial [Candidatus Hinthialibacter sp.]
GIWKYSAEPDSKELWTLIAHINPHLLPDIEGLTIYYGQQPGAGYIIASSQGSNRFTILDRVPKHNFIAIFQIDDHGDIDGAEHTDGIDICSRNLGPSFPQGIFVVQDGLNQGGDETNFKYVSVDDILVHVQQYEK